MAHFTKGGTVLMSSGGCLTCCPIGNIQDDVFANVLHLDFLDNKKKIMRKLIVFCMFMAIPFTETGHIYTEVGFAILLFPTEY